MATTRSRIGTDVLSMVEVVDEQPIGRDSILSKHDARFCYWIQYHEAMARDQTRLCHGMEENILGWPLPGILHFDVNTRD